MRASEGVASAADLVSNLGFSEYGKSQAGFTRNTTRLGNGSNCSDEQASCVVAM